MIKNYIKRVLVLSALVILAAYTVPALMNGFQQETLFLWELVLVSGIISGAQLLLGRFKSNYYVIEVLAEYLMVCLIVGGSGMFFGWFKLNYLWMVLLYVTPVYIIGYFLDMVRTKRELEIINEKIKQRAERGLKNEQ